MSNMGEHARAGLDHTGGHSSGGFAGGFHMPPAAPSPPTPDPLPREFLTLQSPPAGSDMTWLWIGAAVLAFIVVFAMMRR